MVKDPPVSTGDTHSIPGLGRSHVPCGSQAQCHNDWACALEPGTLSSWSLCPGARAFQEEKPPWWEAQPLQGRVAHHSLQLEKVHGQQWRPSTARKKEIKLLKKERKLILIYFSLNHTELFFFPFVASPQGTWSFNSLTRDWTHAPSSGSMAS